MITGRDILPVHYGIAPFAADEYALAIDKVRYVGEEVAAVEEALNLIDVEYEVIPPVLTIEKADASRRTSDPRAGGG